MKWTSILTAVFALACADATAQDAPITPEQISTGAKVYASNCATCHGRGMKNPEWAIDLATIPKNDRQRFIQSVTNGRGNMPPWGDVLKPDEIAALWAYFSMGEK